MGQTALTLFITLATIIFLVFMVGLYVFLLEFRKRKIINEKEKQIAALTGILQGQEEERKRMAKDLHDGIGSLLSGVKLSLSGMKGNQIIDAEHTLAFTNAIAQLDNAINEMRRVAHNMMPEALSQFGLVAAIGNLCETLTTNGKIKIHFEQINFTQRFDGDFEIMVYRIVQELINNAIKHAQCKNIVVQLSQSEKTILLTVEDDGKGMEASQTSGGSGLQNVKSRVEYLKGGMNVKSELGKGTSVVISIQLDV
jgi:signal transduction histidine kinase